MDFYIVDKKIDLEIDGYYHLKEKQKIKDKKRSDFLKSIGIKTIRIKNCEVTDNFLMVYEILKQNNII